MVTESPMSNKGKKWNEGNSSSRSSADSNGGDFLDGGWGWVVLVASFLSQSLLGSIFFAYGVLLPEWMDEFHASRALISFIGATASGLISVTGPLGSFCIQKWGCRVTHVSGGLIVTTGFLLCTIANSMAEIFVFFSIFGGIGFGLCYIPAVICLSKYFRKRRSLALGIASCGVSFGTFTFPILFEYLNQQYGWRGSMLIVGGINGNMIAAGLIMYPAHKAPVTPSVSCVQSNNMDKTIENGQRYRTGRNQTANLTNNKCDYNANVYEIKETDDLSAMIESGECKTTIRAAPVRKTSISVVTAWFRHPWFRRKSSSSTRTLEPSEDIIVHVEGTNNDEIEKGTDTFTTSEMNENCDNVTEKNQKRKKTAPKSFLQLTIFLLTKWKTYAMMCYNFTFFLGMMIVFGLTPSRALYDFGFTSNQGAILVSVLGLASWLGRFLWGILPTVKRVDAMTLFITLRLLAAVMTVVSPYLKSFELQLAYCACVGMAFGCHSLYALVVSKIFGDEALTAIFGYLETFNGIGGVVGPFLGGFIYDFSNSYENSFLIGGAAMFLGCIPLIVREIKIRYSDKAKHIVDVTEG